MPKWHNDRDVRRKQKTHEHQGGTAWGLLAHSDERWLRLSKGTYVWTHRPLRGHRAECSSITGHSHSARRWHGNLWPSSLTRNPNLLGVHGISINRVWSQTGTFAWSRLSLCPPHPLTLSFTALFFTTPAAFSLCLSLFLLFSLQKIVPSYIVFYH